MCREKAIDYKVLGEGETQGNLENTNQTDINHMMEDEPVDLIFASTPCKDFSSANVRRQGHWGKTGRLATKANLVMGWVDLRHQEKWPEHHMIKLHEMVTVWYDHFASSYLFCA